MSHTTKLERISTRLHTTAGRLAFRLQVHTALVGLVAYLVAGGSYKVTDGQLAAILGRSTNHVGVMMRAVAAEGWIDRIPGDVTAHGRQPCRYRINADVILEAIKAATPEAARRRAREAADTATRVAGLGPAYLAGHRRKRGKRARQSHTTVSDTHDSLRSSSGADAADTDAIDYGRPKNPPPADLAAVMRRTAAGARGRWQGQGRHDAVIPPHQRTRLRRGSDDREA